MKITFDTNVLDKVVRVTNCPKNRHDDVFKKINNLIKTEAIKAYFSDCQITLEGIQNKDRIEVFGNGISTTMTIEHKNDRERTVLLGMKMEQERPPLHPANIERITGALDLGIKALKSPIRAGWLTVKDDIGLYDDEACFPTDAQERIELMSQAIIEIEARGVGQSILIKLTDQIAKRFRVEAEPFFVSIARIKEQSEKRAVERAIAEWADADSIGSHIGYKNDYFCTEDFASKNSKLSVLNLENRNWLKERFGVRFLTSAELVNLF